MTLRLRYCNYFALCLSLNQPYVLFLCLLSQHMARQRESMIIFPSSYTCLQCGVSALWEGPRVASIHGMHDHVDIQCDICREIFNSMRSTEIHFASLEHEVQRQERETGYRNSHSVTSPATTTQALITSPISTPTLSPTSHGTQTQTTPTLSATTRFVASATVASQREQLILEYATDHLFWLASIVARQPQVAADTPAQQFISRILFALLSAQPAWDTDFRSFLAHTFPDSLPNAQNLTVQDIVMVLLPVYESWRNYARLRR